MEKIPEGYKVELVQRLLATACAYTEECLENDYTPVWSCFSDNKASVQLAEKLGYTIESAHPIYFAQIVE